MNDKLTGAAYGSSAFLLWVSSLNWPVISMVLGCILGIATFFLNWYYRNKSLRTYKEYLDRGLTNEPERNPEN